MDCIQFDDIAEWQFWAHPKRGSDLCYRYPPTKINLAVLKREKLLKDNSIARVEPIIGLTVKYKETIDSAWHEMSKFIK